MNEETAKALIAEYLKWGECFNRLTELSNELPEMQAKALRGVTAEAEFALYDGLVKMVTREFPELEPWPDED
ncbi:hypothetical protein [Hyphomicrobium sp. D-2]|uniref:hypothetical protein n=1 Tax=Hyphomicrobium sp. D-2 TaxID=3041621 RepID=UPI00245504AE|nr:hypothetical protein [Hyphomicrobium sp. D-2]MDH4982828.1 hypothetical protein [Hyphomicrobium sp. D-2]